MKQLKRSGSAAKFARGLALPFAIGLLAGAGPAWSQQAVLPLSDLLNDTSNALEVLTAEAESASADQDLAREHAEKGLRISSAVGYGMVRNIVDTHRAFTYDAAQAQVGLSYPLLGAAEQSNRRIDAAFGKKQEKEIRVDAARRMARLELESNYARYWGAQESLKVVDAYLAGENQIIPKLQLRAQHKLLLESDQLDVQASYDQAKSDRIRFQRIESEAGSRLQRLVGRPLGNFVAQPVQLPPPPTIQTDELLRHQADITAMRAQRDALKAQLDDSTWYGLDASFDVNASGVKDLSNGGPSGGGTFVGLSLRAPLDVFRAGSAERRRLRAEMEELRLRIEDRSLEVTGEVQSMRQQLAQAQQDDEEMSRRVQASGAGLHESALRGNIFAEDGVEQLGHRLQAYYKAALDEIDARVKAWQANVDLRGYAIAENGEAAPLSLPNAGAAPGAQLANPLLQMNQVLQGHSANTSPPAPLAMLPEPPANVAFTGGGQGGGLPAPSLAAAANAAAQLMPAIFRGDATRAPAAQPMQVALNSNVPAAKSGTPASGLSIYVWNSGDLMTAQNDEKLWNLLKGVRATQLLLALNGQQIADAQVRPQRLLSFLSAAKKHGVSVQLLLGDPSWIEPDQRPKLLAIIGSLRRFDFDGLDLDIEPDQVYRQPLTQGQYDAWIETLHAAAQASPWPTSVSIHPRYFRDPPYIGWDTAQRLRNAGVSQAVLMVFNSDPQRVAATAGPIMADGHGLRFRVAQSVEPQLEPSLSYASKSSQQFVQSMQQLQGLLSGQADFDGVVVQDWTDLMRMGI